LRHHRHFVGIEANPDYCDLMARRLGSVQPVLMIEADFPWSATQ
jgi:DNA modification methylase